MLTNVLLVMVLLLLGFLCWLNMTLYVKAERKSAAAEQDARVERAMEAEQRASRAVDEGIENIMTFQVKTGRGEWSGGEP